MLAHKNVKMPIALKCHVFGYVIANGEKCDINDRDVSKNNIFALNALYLVTLFWIAVIAEGRGRNVVLPFFAV